MTENNDMVLIAVDKRFGKEWYYVFAQVNADEKICRFAKDAIRFKITKRTQHRRIAFALAHDAQRIYQTKHGIRTVVLTSLPN